MIDFELTFVTDEVPDDALDRLCDVYDASTSDHGGSHLLTVLVPGNEVAAAARECVVRCEGLGIVVHRTLPDLVTRSDIADRTHSTPQAVGQWIRGQRLRGSTFPAPYHLVAGGVWLWGEINEWLRVVGKDHDPVTHPSLADHTAIDHWLADRRTHSSPMAVTSTWKYRARAHKTLPARISVVPGDATTPSPWRSSDLIASGRTSA